MSSDAGGAEGLDGLGAVAVDGDGLDAVLPGLDVGLDDVLDRRLVGHVDRLRDGAGDEGLDGAHHLDVAHRADRAHALLGAEGAVEDRQVLVLQAGRALDRALGVDVGDDRLDLSPSS